MRLSRVRYAGVFAEMNDCVRMLSYHSSSNRLSPLDISETTHVAFIVTPEGIQI